MGARSNELPIVVGFRSVAAHLLTKHDETVCLAALDGDDSVFVAIEETSHPVRLLTHAGKERLGTTLAALTVCVPTSRMTPERREIILDDLRAAGERFSELVHWVPAFTVGPELVDVSRA